MLPSSVVVKKQRHIFFTTTDEGSTFQRFTLKNLKRLSQRFIGRLTTNR